MCEGIKSVDAFRRWRFYEPVLLTTIMVAAVLSALTFSVVHAETLSSADAEPVVIYPASGNPLNVAVESPGRIWYTLPDQNAVASLIVGASGSYTTTLFEIPQPDSRPYDIAYANGTVWFTERNAGRIGAIDVATGELSEYLIAVSPPADSSTLFLPSVLSGSAPNGKEVASQPTGIAVAPNGIVWFVLFGTNQLGRFDPITKSIDLFVYPQTGAELEDVAVGLSNSPWVAAPGVNQVERFDHIGESFDTTPSTGVNSAPFNVAVDGFDTPWVTAPGREQAGRFLFGTLSLWVWFPSLETTSKLHGIALSQTDSAQKIWVTDSGNNAVIQYNREGSFTTIRTLDLPEGSTNPQGIAADEQEHAWIAVEGAIVEWRPPYGQKIYLSSLRW